MFCQNILSLFYVRESQSRMVHWISLICPDFLDFNIYLIKVGDKNLS